MFEYSCCRSDLINWVYSQVDHHAGVLFPQKKGWRFYLKYLYPFGTDTSVFIALVSNNNECLMFVPIDEYPEESDIKSLANNSILSYFKKEIHTDIAKHQIILITSEKYEKKAATAIKQHNLKVSLLQLTYDTVSFAFGGFNNPRLEFRLSQLEFDPDTVSRFIPTNQYFLGDKNLKALFYQNFFHCLDHFWISGKKALSLRELIGRSIPQWRQFRRAEQQLILSQIKSDLTTIFENFFNGSLSLKEIQKKKNSQPETVVELLIRPDSKKNLSFWARNQKSALDYLKTYPVPISIQPI